MPRFDWTGGRLRAYVFSVAHAIAGEAFDVIVDRLTSRTYVQLLIDKKFLYELTKYLREAHRLLSDKAPDKLDGFLLGILKILLLNEVESDSEFRLEAIVSWLDAYRDRDFLFDLLERGTRLSATNVSSGDLDGFRSRCGGHLAGLSRRDVRHLKRARHALPEIIDFWKKSGALAVLGTFEYEMAFAAYLHGELDEAIAGFATSAQHAEEGGDRLGAAIGHCLVACVRLRTDRQSGADCMIVMEKAREEFNRIAEKAMEGSREHRLSYRWLMSLKIHAFEGAFAIRQRELAQRYCDELRRDDFIRSSVNMDDAGRSAIVLRCEARLQMLDQQWSDAAATFGLFLPIGHDEVPSRDSAAVEWRIETNELAWEYLDYGIALDELGLPQLAEEAWATGLNCEPDFGNAVWQTKIRNRLADRRPL